MAHKEKRKKKTLPLLLAALTLAGAGLWWGNYTLSVLSLIHIYKKRECIPCIRAAARPP